MEGELDNLIEPKAEYEAKIYEEEKNMLLLRKPNIWNSRVKGNMEVESEVEFEKFLISLSEHTNEGSDEITVFRFYSLIDLLTEKFKKDAGSDN